METTTGMSAPPIGMMSVTPKTIANTVIAQNVQVSAPWLVTRSTINATMATAMRMLMTWRAGRMIGAPDMLPLSLAKAMIEPENVTAPMATPIDISIKRLHVDVAGFADAHGLGRVERGGGDENRRKADEAVKRRDELRHLGHRDLTRGDGADRPADGDAEQDQAPGQDVAGARDRERGGDGDRHTDHAELIAAARGNRARQSAQGQNEQDARDQIEQCGEVGVHCLEFMV